MRIVLGSSSPRRRELLASLGVPFRVASPDIDETEEPDEDPRAYVWRIAATKLAHIDADPDEMVITADTTVDLDGRIIAKPADRSEAIAMLTALAGRTHLVHTGVCMRLGNRQYIDVATTGVTFTPLSSATIEWYVDHDNTLDKAGAYGMQGAAGAFVERIDGSASNVIGLPLHLVVALAKELGVDLLSGAITS